MRKTSLVIGALVVQATIVTVMLVSAMMPLWTGQEVTVMARAVDPRDLMRGDYVALDYEFNHIDPDQVLTDFKLYTLVPYGKELYVTLRLTDSGAVASGIYATQPDQGLFVKGRSSKRQYVDTLYGATLEVSYGIEEFYTDSDMAQRLERNLRTGKGIPVKIMVDDQGNARIQTIGDRGD